MRLWNRIAVWFKGSRPHSIDDTAMPAGVWVCRIAFHRPAAPCRSQFAWITGKVRLMTGEPGGRLPSRSHSRRLEAPTLLVEDAVGLHQHVAGPARHARGGVVADQLRSS